MTYELFQQGPSVYMPYILVSLAVTLAAYGAFPLILARARKRAVTKKRYRASCFGFNLLVLIAFCFINGGFSSWAPYILWTAVFSGVGVKMLGRRGVLSAPKHCAGAQAPSGPASPEPDAFPVSDEELQDLFGDVLEEPESAPPRTEAPAPELRQAPAPPRAEAPAPDESARTKKRRGAAALIILSVFLAASLALNVWQYLQSAPLAAEIEELQESVDSLNSAVAAKNKTIASLSEKANLYDFICLELSSGDYGYASSSFNASESVIVLGLNETGRKFTLTANWPSGGTVRYHRYGTSADISFDSDTWYTSTTMSVLPLTEGVTKFAFYNTVDSSEFKLLVIVTA